MPNPTTSAAVVPIDAKARRPRVSVIIPTYNRAPLVVQAVESVLAQTLPDREVIVVDDGSTDETWSKLRPYFGRIRYFWQENRGIAAARNRGIREARGEYLAFLDSDDQFEPEMLESAIRTFDEYPAAGAVVTAEREIDSHDAVRGRVFTKRTAGLFFSPANLIARDTHVGCGRPAVVRRSWVDRLGGFDETIRCAVDCEMWIRYSFHMPMVLQPNPLVLRRKHDSNISENRKQDALDWLQILDWVADERPDFVQQNRKTYRRCRHKNYLRYGRELLAEYDGDPALLAEIRRALKKAFLLRPWTLRAQIYLLWSYAAPSTYPGFRRWELTRLRSH